MPRQARKTPHPRTTLPEVAHLKADGLTGASQSARHDGDMLTVAQLLETFKAHLAQVVPIRELRDVTVADVAAAFLAAKEGTVKDTTHYVYRCLLKRPLVQFGSMKTLDLQPADVLRWLAGLPLSKSTRSGIAGTLCDALRWAESTGLIAANPLRTMKRPAKESRGAKTVISAQAHRAILAVANPQLGLLLELLYQTGARPSELTTLTAADVNFDHRVALLREHKTAHHTGQPRLIVLSPAAAELLRARAQERPDGPLLRNTRGKPWTKDAIVLAVRTASKRAGVKVTAYGYRHTFATNALEQGLPDAHVAALLGQSSTAMLHKHYSHLTAQTQSLRTALARVRG